MLGHPSWNDHELVMRSRISLVYARKDLDTNSSKVILLLHVLIRLFYELLFICSVCAGGRLCSLLYFCTSFGVRWHGKAVFI